MRSSKPPSRSTRPGVRRGGPPTWLIFLLGIALVFGIYYIWQGVQGFIRSGGLTIGGATEQAVIVATETAEVIETRTGPAAGFTPIPTRTPLPECQDFVVSVPSAVIREGPTTGSLALDSRSEGELVCVLERAADNSQWYLIDLNPATRRIEAAYMFEDIVQALNPTLTPSLTFTPAPTVTPVPTNTPTLSPTPAPTATPDLAATDTPTPTPPPTPTTPLQSI